ncbi:S-adenosyl methyltransferase [Amycolatopsis pretoriensis]|uniref:S-adenosyl methyltransferase n=1 Tax=Amycolatopsis pretoriensis TaxID=218821 RepID=A0A1H5RJ61_9PSEU|nr:SAM-dependent methyltransferase [Amycolatopsis pretoriensis]SEF38124.1 S-adenosyl methyltransferase [Amycolatopsis pretoriensis]
MSPNPRLVSGSQDSAEVDIERERRDAVVDYLLGDSHNSSIDRMFADTLVAGNPQLPRLAIVAAAWDRTAAQTMLDHGLRRFLVLGTGGFPIWARSSTLADLHDAGARIVVVEHDPVTRHLHALVDHGAAAGRAHVLHLPAHRHHNLATAPAVAPLLAGDAPLGILATGLLRPADIRLADILSLLDSAPPGSLAAITQLTQRADDNPAGTDVARLAARFVAAGIPIAVENRPAIDQLLPRDVVYPAASCDPPPSPDRDKATSVLRTALLARRQPPAAAAGLLRGEAFRHGANELGVQR